MYKDYQGAMKYGNIFSINIGPNYAGKIRDIDVKTLKQVGQMIRAEGAAQPKARALLQAVVKDYPGSPAAAEAKKELAKLK